MPNITSVLNEQIRRLAKREITANTKGTRKATAHYRHDLAALKRQVAELTKRLGQVEKKHPKEMAAPPEVVEKARFRAMGVRAHRAKLGLSAKDYGKLVGVSHLSIYQWESGKTRPRRAALAKWLAVRGLGKREAMERLGMGGSEVEATAVEKGAAREPSRRGGQAQGFILGLLGGGESMLTAQVNAAWKKARRPGLANKTLGLLVKAGRLKRMAVKGARGSAYVLAGKGGGAAVVKAGKAAVKAPAAKAGRSRGFGETAQDLIVSLLKGGKSLTTGELAAAWNKAGRGGAVDNALSKMTKAKQLTRTPLGGKKGSVYSVR